MYQYLKNKIVLGNHFEQAMIYYDISGHKLLSVGIIYLLQQNCVKSRKVTS